MTGILALSLSGGAVAALPGACSTGPNPQLPSPEHSLFPTVNIAPATGWPDAGMPIPAQGLCVNRFASGLLHLRCLLVLQNGDVLVA